MQSKLTTELHAAVTKRNQTALWMRDVSGHWPTPLDMDRHRKRKMAGRQTGSSCISRSILDSVEIPKPTHRFSGSTKSADSPPTPSDIDRQQKHKMAAAAGPQVVGRNIDVDESFV
jgi:hypothetical protein